MEIRTHIALFALALSVSVASQEASAGTAAEYVEPVRRCAVRERMEQIHRRFGVSFIYDTRLESLLDGTVEPLSEDETSLDDALSRTFKGTDISWQKDGNDIVLKIRQKTASVSGGKVTISGYIRESVGGETLIGAGVTVLPASRSLGAVSNDYGYYTLTISAGNIDLTYSYVGCADVHKSIDLQRDTVINVTLVPTSSLEAATVVARKDAGIRSTYMGALEIPQEMIRNTPVVLGEPDVIKTIQMMPGVQGGMEGFSGIYVRGGGADENLMMLDGTPLYNVSHLLGLLSVFTPEAVKKVTFYKGSFPARYGGRVSSIVDVRTNDGNANGFHGSVSAGLLTEKLHFEGPIASPNTTFSVSARGMHTFLFDRLVKACGSPANYAFYDVNAKVAHRFSDSDRLFLSFYHGRDYFRFDTADKNSYRYYGDDYEPYTRYQEEDDKMNLRWGNTLAALRWNHVFGSKLFANATASFNSYDMNLKSTMRELTRSETENYDKQSRYSYSSGIRDLNVRLDFDYTPVPSHLIKFGGEYVHHTYKPEMERSMQSNELGNDIDKTETGAGNRIPGNEMSLYIEDDMSIGEHLSFNPGIHLSLFSVSGRTYFCPEPRAAAKVSFGDGWAVKAAYSRMSQYVHQLTSGSLSLPTDLWVPITKDIRPVASDLVSLGGYFSGLKGWEFSVEGYWKRMDNVLEYKDGKMAFSSATDWEENVAMGQGRSYGMEVYVQKTLGRTTGSVSYTLSKSDRIFRGGEINDGRWFPFVYDRRHVFTAVVNQKLGKRVDLGAVWTYSSGNWMTVPTRSTVVLAPDGKDFITVDYIESRNNYKLPPSHRLDLSVNVHKQKRRGERIWNFGLYNAYGALNPNWVVVDDREVKDPDTGKSTFIPALSKRTFLLFLPSFSYTFRF